MNKIKLTAWFFLLLIVFNSCTYYRLRQGSPKDYYVGIEKEEMKTSRVYVHIGDSYFELRNWKKFEDTITGTLSSVPPEIDLYYQLALKRGDFKASKIERHLLYQVHLFLPTISIKDKEITFSVSEIEKVQILNKDIGLTTLSWTLSGAAVLTGTISLFLWIACSCPHVYLNDGQNWFFSNSMFTGAMNPTLERYDFKEIADFQPESSEIEMEIRNEEKEIQYTNLLKLIAVYHEKDEEIISTSKGEFVSVINTFQPKRLLSDNEILDPNFFKAENNSFTFDEQDNSGFSNLQSVFEVNNLENPHLILGLKNQKWGGYVYNEFTKLFGRFFQKWVNSNSKKDKNQLEKNMMKAGILLQLEVFDRGKWTSIENINLVGEAKFEKIAVQIPKKYLNNKEITFRLRSGFKFWEINSLELASINSKLMSTQEIEAKIINSELENKSKALNLDDSDYLIHKEGDAPYTIKFEGLKTNSNRTLFLKSKGYYKNIQNFDGKPKWSELLAINKQGGLSIYSKDKYEDWNQLTHTLTELGITERINVK
jgi:hypothetical protein